MNPSSKSSEAFTGTDKDLYINSQIAKQRYEKFQKQDEILYLAFSGRPKTMLQVSIQTGIYRSNICRWIAKMQRKSSIYLIKYGNCPISKYKAGFYTTIR